MYYPHQPAEKEPKNISLVRLPKIETPPPPSPPVQPAPVAPPNSAQDSVPPQPVTTSVQPPNEKPPPSQQPGQYTQQPIQTPQPAQYSMPASSAPASYPVQYSMPPPGGAPGAYPAQYSMPPPGGQYGIPSYGQPQYYGQQQQPPYYAQPQYGVPPPGQYTQPQPLQQAYAQQPQQKVYAQQPVMGRTQIGMPTMIPVPGLPAVINLEKGQNMSLTKTAPSLRYTLIGLGWDVRQTPGAPFDLDTSMFLLTDTGRVRQPTDFIFYNNRQSTDGSVCHLGDNLTGAGEGDDEQMTVDLTRVPSDVTRIVVSCSIYEADQRQQNFGMVQRAYMRIVDQGTYQEIVRYDLTQEACMWNTMLFGEIYRYGVEWKFKALGIGMQGGLRALGAQYGLNLG